MQRKLWRRRQLALLFAAFLVLVVQAPPRALAQLEIDITQGTIEPMPVAIYDFLGKTEEASQFGRDITSVINDDLERSGLFQPLEKEAFIEKITRFNKAPRFGD